MNIRIKENLIEQNFISTILKQREPDSHKGDYGHACLICGSESLMGAAVLMTKACLRSGAGKVTTYAPKIGYDILQISAPEAMTKICGKKYIKQIYDLKKFSAVGVGPGLGLYKSHTKLLKQIFLNYYNKPLLADADALNIISQDKSLLKSLPQNSVITPHAAEFERLFGKTVSHDEQVDLALKMAHQFKIYIVLKGHNTLIATPSGKSYFNSTGNAGMATGGTGDVLAGLITGLLAQGYSSLHACLLGVYLHGLAGDIAATKHSQNALIAGDIIDHLGEAFKCLSSKSL